MATRDLVISFGALYLAEKVIRDNQEFYEKFNTNNKLNDFESGDIVSCTFLKGLFRVSFFMSNSNTKLVLMPIDYNGEVLSISPEFVKKAKVSDKTLRVLYES